MRIGIDVDNTILDYSRGFLTEVRMLAGLEQTDNASKGDLKSVVTKTHGDEEWTKIQGRVYSSVPSGVEIFAGFPELLGALIKAGHSISYMSHKSRHPIAGPPIELRKPVTDYLYANKLISPSQSAVSLTFFETKEEKISAIVDSSFDVYIDDLPEIIESVGFTCEAIHFGCVCSPGASHLGFKDWLSISTFFAPNL